MRWLVLFALGTPRTRLPSLLLAVLLILIGFQIWIVGLVADLLATNRRLLEDIQFRIRRAELSRRE